MTMSQSNHSLDAWLTAARADVACHCAPPAIGADLRARLATRKSAQSQALRPSRRTSPAWRRWLVIGVPSALAALVVLAVGAVWTAGSPQRGASESPAATAAAPAFIALTSLEAIAAESSPLVMPAQMARAQLADYGLPVDPSRADQPVRAELLVSQRGAVLAVRFVE
jgi:hypothetical protein